MDKTDNYNSNSLQYATDEFECLSMQHCTYGVSVGSKPVPGLPT